MNCSACTKINPIPSCLTGYGTFEIANITFPDHSGDAMILKVTDTATRQVTYLEFIADQNIDITDLFPLMQHYYMFEFYEAGVKVDFIIFNTHDETQSTGCCIEVIPAEGLDWDGSEYNVSTTNCIVP